MSNNSSSGGDDPPPAVGFQDYLIAIMLVLLIAAIVAGGAPKTLSRLFPAPVLMFILALVVALIALSSDAKGFVFHVTSDTVDSDALQTLYLPPLLFSDVMRLNIRTFRRSFWQVMWLIFPGVIGGAAMTALYPWFFMPSGPPYFSAYESLAFGAALSTTDPIAVLMVLNDIGAPKQLTALVGGESLLNDGSSIVIVTLFLQLQAGMVMTGGDIVGFCFQEVLAGPAFGLLVGILTLFLMRLVESNVVAIVMLSFAVPYLTFAISLYYFETSGVLAVIVLGLLLNRFGHPFMSKQLEAVEGFWDQIEFIATMILYAQVGLWVASDFLQGSITGTDWGSLIGIFLWVLLVRAVVVLVSFPILTRIGYGLTWQEAIVVWHAGLRGGVSVLLSFTIKNSPGVAPRTGALVLFFTAGIVVLFLINIITTGPLCRLLGLQFDASNKVYRRLRYNIEETTLRTLMCTGMEEEVARNGIEFYAKDPMLPVSTRSLVKQPLLATPKASAPPADEEVLATKRKHVCMAFQATFEGLMETELIPRKAWFLLINACEKKIDNTPVQSLLAFDDIVRPGSFFSWFARLVVATTSFEQCNKATKARERRQVLKQLLFNRFTEEMRHQSVVDGEAPDFKDILGTVEVLAYCAFGLIIAHQRGRRTLHDIFAVLKEEDDVPDEELGEDMPAGDSFRGEGRFGQQPQKKTSTTELRQIIEESKRDCIRPALFLDLVFKFFPEVIERIKATHARAQVHDQNIKLLGGMKRDGFVAGTVLKQLVLEVERLDESVKKLEFPVVPPLTVGTSGAGLGANPNFGPFVGLRKRRASMRGATVPTALPLSPRKPVSPIASDGAIKQELPEFQEASARHEAAKMPPKASSSPQQAVVESVTALADAALPSPTDEARNTSSEAHSPEKAEDLTPETGHPKTEDVAVKDTHDEDVRAEGTRSPVSDEAELREAALDQMLDRVDDFLADQVENDPELKTTF